MARLTNIILIAAACVIVSGCKTHNGWPWWTRHKEMPVSLPPLPQSVQLLRNVLRADPDEEDWTNTVVTTQFILKFPFPPTVLVQLERTPRFPAAWQVITTTTNNYTVTFTNGPVQPVAFYRSKPIAETITIAWAEAGWTNTTIFRLETNGVPMATFAGTKTLTNRIQKVTLTQPVSNIKLVAVLNGKEAASTNWTVTAKYLGKPSTNTFETRTETRSLL